VSAITQEVSATAGQSISEVRALRLIGAGTAVLRYGVVFLLTLFGIFKFFAFEAEGVQGLLASSPFMSWMTPLFGVRGASDVIGVVELSAAVLIAMRRWSPRLSAYGSLVASFTFLVTLSFLFTTPGATAPESPIGGFLMKDVVLLGASLYTAGEAWLTAATGQRRGLARLS
jgi:uncharacterized membrane protein YkgB